MMGSFGAIANRPFIEVFLEYLYCGIDFLTESHLVEFLEHGFMEPLTDPAIPVDK
jgi:hypothetical protein